MENCLVTKLKESVNNPNLELFGYIPVNIYGSEYATIYISSTSDVVVKTSSNVKLVVDNVEYDEYTYLSGNNIKINIHSTDGNDGYIFLGDKYSTTTYLNLYLEHYSHINLENLKYATSFRNISGVSCIGQLSSLSNLVNLVSLSFSDSNDDVYGNLSSLSGLTNLSLFRIYSQNITGELKNIANLANIETVDVRTSKVFGSIEDFADLLAPNKNNGDVVNVISSGHITYNGEFISNTHVATITFNGTGGYNVVVE